jgi:hypothetical protein
LSEIPGERSETPDLATKDVDGRVKPGHDENDRAIRIAEKMQKACDRVVWGCVEHKNVWGFAGLPLESP